MNSSKKKASQVLMPQHLAKLRACGLSDATIRLSGIHSECDPKRLQKILRWNLPAKKLGPCIVIPFIDLQGKPTPYSRLRPDNPREQHGRVAKYESPLKVPSHIYFPPYIRSVQAKISEPVIITEGEFKALASDQLGFATLGITGASMWSKPKKTEGEVRTLHPDLASIVWPGRLVYLCFDSDVVYKNEVRWEEWKLAQSLSEVGAMVKTVRLPAKLGGPKVGLDDYIMAAGPDAANSVRKLLREACDRSLPPDGFSNSVLRPNPHKPGEFTQTGRSLVEMAAELVGHSGGWPRNVGGVLVGPDAEKGVRLLGGANELSAFIHSKYDTAGASGTYWRKGPTFPTLPELQAYLQANCEQFERADSLPHMPPIPGVFYTKLTPAPDGKYKAIEDYLSFFEPETNLDYSLLVALLLTLFWGGPAGKRPGFLIEGAEDDSEAGRGLGKSTLAQKFAQLAGGAFDINAAEPFSRTLSRLLTPQAGRYRVLLMDNVKSFRLSNAELEGLVTNPWVNGHRLYHGQAGVPNYYTLIITLNGASLSKDFAQRLITTRVKRTKNKHGWEAKLDRFVDLNRERIIGDIVGLLSRPVVQLPHLSRWGPWETEVLGRVEHAVACWDLIQSRMVAHDADREDGDRIRETLAEIIQRHDSSNVHEQRFLLTSAAITALVGLAFNDKSIRAGAASATLKAQGVKGFRKSDRNGRRLWEWRGDLHPIHSADEKTPRILTYDPESRRNDMGRSGADRWIFMSLEEIIG